MSTLQTYNLKHPDASGNQITFTSGGLVGVGTSSPGYPLTIACNGSAQGVSLEGRAADDIGEFTFFENDGTTQLGRLQARQSYFQISATDNTNGIFIDNSSDVGIGQSSPVARLDVNGNQTSNVVAMAALDVDCSAGNYFTKTINGNSAFTFSNVPSSRSFSFVLELTHTSGTVTWPASVKFPGDTAPTLTTGKTHLFVFETNDGGTRFRGAALVDYVN